MPKSLARMTARSVVLSVLLGAHPAWASAAELIRLTNDFDIKEATLRVALTRMVSAGDLVRSADGYRLADRLLARQRRQDDAMRPPLRPWRGYWTTLIVTSIGTDARTRAALRTTMHHKRFGELREGVWMRPDNLDLDLADEDRARVRIVRAQVPLRWRMWSCTDSTPSTLMVRQSSCDRKSSRSRLISVPFDTVCTRTPVENACSRSR